MAPHGRLTTRAALVLGLLALVACERSRAPKEDATAPLSASASPIDASPAPDASSSLAACDPPHVVVVPPSASSDTTIVFLHGYGANAADIAPVAKTLANAVHAAAIVPDGCDAYENGGGDARQWMSARGATEESRSQRLREVAARFEAWLGNELAARGLPTKRVVFGGFSQGAMLSMYFATHHVPVPAAIVSFSGKLVEVDD